MVVTIDYLDRIYPDLANMKSIVQNRKELVSLVVQYVRDLNLGSVSLALEPTSNPDQKLYDPLVPPEF